MLRTLFIICFVPVILMQLSGLLMSPVLLFSAEESSGKSLIAIVVIVLGFNGVSGAWGLLELSVAPFKEKYPLIVLKKMLLQGIVAACSIWFIVDINITVLMIICPSIIMTSFLVFRQKNYLVAANKLMKKKT